MKVYKVTGWQLFTMWLFGILGFIAAMAVISINSSNQGPMGSEVFWLVFIPFFLVFYTIGRRKFRKNESKDIKK